MKKILLISFLLMFMSAAAYSESRTIRRDVRDSKGKLTYRNRTTGNVTETYNDRGKLLNRTKTIGGATEVKDESGKLIERVNNRR